MQKETAPLVGHALIWPDKAAQALLTPQMYLGELMY